ncbi:AIM24 family protein [Bifidobacterium stellenboschense]|uniref:Transcriptional regulator n=1 Tax=Bifidobacterium stellenboschense TaxID=762211 RepID=A0A087DPA2_9BIFI|nr:AIM24 family protein [Bifidobacterium stellenboschense]KFI97352.1 transcriptional regulator [Bifidobacterium stellenboschense]
MRIYNFTDNDDVAIVARQGPFQVIEWKRDLSVDYGGAAGAYFASEMNVRRRQVVCTLDGKTGITVQAGAMQWTAGHIQATTGVKGVGDFIGKMARGAVTKESAVKPEYQGIGTLVLEPTYRHILLIDPAAQMGGSMTVNDGLFYACESTVRQRAVMVSRPSAMVAGGEGLFNLALEGQGTVALESPVPASELITVDLENDELKIDGNFAIAWTSGLQFTVERSGKTLIGSAASGEGLVNVYRGVGRVLLAPVSGPTFNINAGSGTV